MLTQRCRSIWMILMYSSPDLKTNLRNSVRIRLLGFDQGADPKEEAGVAMAQTKAVRCRWDSASVEGLFLQKIIRYKSLQSKETVLYMFVHT